MVLNVKNVYVHLKYSPRASARKATANEGEIRRHPNRIRESWRALPLRDLLFWRLRQDIAVDTTYIIWLKLSRIYISHFFATENQKKSYIFRGCFEEQNVVRVSNGNGTCALETHL